MKPAYIALAALLLLSTSARAQNDPTPETDTAIESSESSGAEAGDTKETARPAPVKKDAPFKELAGRWVGEGRIGMSEGKVESVKCRATYFVEGGGNELRQNIRCASSGGKVEVKSNVTAKGGQLTGTWNELVYNFGGDLKGEVTERGFRISVKGGDLTANMDVIVLNDRQVVEIQFFNSSLRGLMLILKKG